MTHATIVETPSINTKHTYAGTVKDEHAVVSFFFHDDVLPGSSEEKILNFANEVMDEAVEPLETSLIVEVPLMDILNDEIASHRYCAFDEDPDAPVVMSDEYKPHFEIIKKDLIALLDKINKFQYLTDEEYQSKVKEQ